MNADDLATVVGAEAAREMSNALARIKHCVGQLDKEPRMDIAAEFVSAIINAFEANKRLADRAVEQVPDEKLHVAIDGNTNSIAVIMKHLAGNLTSRWTDFQATDGEKPWRNRDDEFVDSFKTRAELLECWERGWACLLTTLKGLTPGDLGKTVMILPMCEPWPLMN